MPYGGHIGCWKKLFFLWHFIPRYGSGIFFLQKIMLPMLKLDTNYSFPELFLNS
jgi:hypothetical protein